MVDFSLTTRQVVHSRDHPGRAEYLYLLMLQDYTTLTLYHVRAARKQLCRQLPDTVGQSLTVRKNSVLKDTDYLIKSLDEILVHLDKCQQQVRHWQDHWANTLRHFTRPNFWKN